MLSVGGQDSEPSIDRLSASSGSHCRNEVPLSGLPSSSNLPREPMFNSLETNCPPRTFSRAINGSRQQSATHSFTYIPDLQWLQWLSLRQPLSLLMEANYKFAIISSRYIDMIFFHFLEIDNIPSFIYAYSSE